MTPSTGPHPDRPLKVWYHTPPQGSVTTEVLIVIPGMNRNAENYRDNWRDLADEYGFLLLVPEFPSTLYTSTEYNLGNLTAGPTEAGAPNPPDEWTFSVIEELFDWARQTGSEAEEYHLYGHSAGAQFVHRFMLYMPSHRVQAAVAANAGWYTVPDPNIEYPYGTDGGPDLVLPLSFVRTLTVLAGEDDTDTENLRTSEPAMAQGENRLERAEHFYDESMARADELGVGFRWAFDTVPDAGHSNAQMAPSAAAVLFD